MDRQKIFWVVLSVSVFVVVVLVVGVLLLRQRPAGVASAPGTVSPLSDTGTGIYEYQREPAAPSQTGAGQSGNHETMHFYIGEGSGAATGQPAQSGASAAPAATPPTAGSTGSPSAQPAQPRVTPPVKPSTAKPSLQAKTPQKVIDFWIQTGSYKSQAMAEQLAALLGGKGLSGRVFSSTFKNETFYRVRIGPYANKGDAEKFLAIVKQVQGLESSYISQVPTTKSSVN